VVVFLPSKLELVAPTPKLVAPVPSPLDLIESVLPSFFPVCPPFCLLFFFFLGLFVEDPFPFHVDAKEIQQGDDELKSSSFHAIGPWIRS
jgi:hypothetical protein